jgi:hypothetical protein
MGHRRFEMHEYRHVLQRMRQGDTDRAISRARLMGRRKAGEVREVAEAGGGGGWLDPAVPLPPDEATAGGVAGAPAAEAANVADRAARENRSRRGTGRGCRGRRSTPRLVAREPVPRRSQRLNATPRGTQERAMPECAARLLAQDPPRRPRPRRAYPMLTRLLLLGRSL